MRTKLQIRRRRNYAFHARLLVASVVALLCGAHTLRGQSTALIYNLNVPDNQPGVGNIATVLPGTGYGVGFVNGATPYVLNSITLEFIGTSLPAAGFGVQFYSFGAGLGGPGSNLPVTLEGQLGHPVISPQQTLYPGYTTYITFTPTTPITIAPNSGYMIGATEDASGNDDNGLLFAPNNSAYTVASGVQIFNFGGLPGAAEWTFDQSSDAWSAQPFGQDGELKIELDATPAPEPSVLALLLAGGAVCICARRKHQSRAVL